MLAFLRYRFCDHGCFFFRVVIAPSVNTISPLADNSEIYPKGLGLPYSLPPNCSLILLRIEPLLYGGLSACKRKNHYGIKMGIDAGIKKNITIN